MTSEDFELIADVLELLTWGGTISDEGFKSLLFLLGVADLLGERSQLFL